MNIKKITDIVNDHSLTVTSKERAIITVLSEDPNVLTTIISLLAVERNTQKELVSDLNLEVSRYHAMVTTPKLLKGQEGFLNDETKSLYEKWKAFIKPLFNNKFDKDEQ